MGARGPLKLLHGDETPGPIVEGSVAAQVEPKAPTKPAGVLADKELSELWDEVVPGLDATGLTTPADVAAVEIMLRHVLLVRMAHREIVASGHVVAPARGQDVEKKHPAEAILRMESAMAMEWAERLGMTWRSRARTTAAPRTGGEDGSNPFAAKKAASE